MTRQIGPRVAVADVPHGLVSRAEVEMRPDPGTGEPSPRTDRQGRLRYDRVWLEAAAPATDPVAVARAAGVDDATLTWLTSAPRRGTTVTQRLAPEWLATVARAGLVRLLHREDAGRLGDLTRVEIDPRAATAVARWADHLAAATAASIDMVDAAWAGHSAPARAWAADRAGRANARAVQVLARLGATLPATGIPLSALALEVTDDSHAFDPNGQFGHLAAEAAAAAADMDLPANSAARREAWAAVGVLVDPWSTSTTGLRLPYHPSHPAGHVVTAHAGRVAVVTLEVAAAAHNGPLVVPPLRHGGTLWVVENAATLAVLTDVNTGDPVLCRLGTPSVSDRALVRAVAAAGWQVAVTSDFEPGGLRGARTLLEDAGGAGVPWRLSADDYEPALTTERFAGFPGPTPWDPALAERMAEHRARVLEEHRLEVLAADLGGASP